MAKRRKRRRIWPVVIVTVCLLAGGAVAVYKLLPGISDSALEAVEAVRTQAVNAKNVVMGESGSVAEEEVEGGYYYQQLADEEKSLYREMYQGIRDSADSITVHTDDITVLKKICDFIFNDRPELFWCRGEMTVKRFDGYSAVSIYQMYTGGERAGKQAEIEAAAQECLSGITPEMTEYDKIKYIFEYIVNTVDYNLEAPDNQTIYSSLVGKSSVCAGYSRAAQYLLQQIGIECIYVTGNIPQQEFHAWNIVKCDGQYYQMDITFGDPVFLGGDGSTGVPLQAINYDYLCCSDAELLKNHVMDTEVAYPPCTSMDLNYYKLNGMYYEAFNPEQLLQDMNESVYNGSPSFTCKFANDTLYQEAHDYVLNNLVQSAAQNLLNYYGLESVQYTYQDDNVMNKIVIYWSYQ